MSLILFTKIRTKQMILGQLSPAIKLIEGMYEVALIDCVVKNTYDIMRKDRTY